MDTHSEYNGLLLRHRSMLWRMCWLRSHGQWDCCCDLMQEVAIALWKNRGKLRPGSTQQEERAWVRWQARSVFDSQRRHKTLYTVPIDDALAHTLAASDSSATDETVDDALAALGPDERRMVRLRLDGYCADEIADLLGIGRDAVYQRLHRAVVKMRRVVLALLAIFATASIAVAVVPQWRNALFGGTAEEPPSEKPIPTPSVDAVVPDVATPEPTPAMPATRHRAEPMPHLESMEVQEPAEQLPPVATDPVVALDGNKLTVSGVYDERVSVYSRNGSLLASQMCNGICTLTILPDDNMLTARCRYGDIIVKVGDRPEILIFQ